MTLLFNKQWVLRGSFSDYRILHWSNDAVFNEQPRVPASIISASLERWLSSSPRSLQEMYEALGGDHPLGLSTLQRNEYDQRLRNRLAEAFNRGELIALQIALPEPHRLPPREAPKTRPEPEPEQTFIALKLVDVDGNPIPSERYRLTLPNGTTREGTLDDKGEARVDGIAESGECKVEFPDIGTEGYLAKENKSLSTGQLHIVPLAPAIKVTYADDHFAPSTESLDIKYTIPHPRTGKSIKLQVLGLAKGEELLFERELTDQEKSRGEHTVHWDGMATSEGEMRDRYVDPLHGPYKVRIAYPRAPTDGSNEKPFDVLYHSVELTRGPWTPDEQEPPETQLKDWVQYKLNELGYYGGPVGKDTDDYLKKAIIRYKANHKALHQLHYALYNDSITDALKDALRKGENRRDFFRGNAITDSSAQSELLVEALTYEDGELAASAAQKTRDRLNRPLLPLAARLFLKKKDDSKVFAPEAVGAARINWRFKDANEDLTAQYIPTPTQPSLTRKYIEKVLKLEGGFGTDGDNCPKTFEGVRVAPASNWSTPFLMGDFYQPYVAQEDAANKVVYTEACIDKQNHPKRLGTAGVFFRPSFIAGDDYQLTAELDFTGHPNKAEREQRHGIKDASTRIHAQTGTFRIRRFSQVAVVVDWPARSNAYEWNLISDEFFKAHLELDTAHIASKRIKEVLTEDQYRDIVVTHTAHVDRTQISLHDDAIVGVALPAQGNVPAARYKRALKLFTSDNYWDLIYTPLREKLSANLRKDYPSGFIVVNFLTHKPVNVQTAPPADVAVTPAHQNHVTWSFSIGLPDSVIFADQKDPDKVYYVVAHEMGHNFWLKHWENADGSTPDDHDQDDHNCIMSYSTNSGLLAAIQAPGIYTPHFCGQCNLKLRGWDIDQPTMPATSV